MEFVANQPQQRQRAISMEFMHEYRSRIQRITTSIGFDRNEYVGMYLSQLESCMCMKPKSVIGGVFPITVDPETSESYCLLGLAYIRRRDCDGDDEYFYTLPDNTIGGVRNVLCHFHGWVDCYESRSQAKAREGYEESRGVFGSMVDIWRCLSLPGYSYQMPHLRPMSLINLGKMNATDRASLVARYLQCPIYSAAMTETRGVRFVPLSQLYDLLKHSYHFEVPSSLTPIDDTQFPNDSVVIRYFLKNWLTEELEEEYSIRDLTFYDEVDITTLPTQICSPWHGQQVTLIPVEQTNSRQRCHYCSQQLLAPPHTHIPHYSCPKSRYFSEDVGMTYYHAQCIFEYDPSSHAWNLKDERILCRDYYRFKFFEDPVVQKIMHGDADIPIQPITSLPPIEREVSQTLQDMLQVSEELQRDYPIGRQYNRDEREHLITCATCGDKVYVDRAHYRTCRICKIVSDRRYEMTGGRAGDGGRGRGRGRGRGGGRNDSGRGRESRGGW
jgi:hypothetical protein